MIVTNADEALSALRGGLSLSPTLRGEAELVVEALRGSLDASGALRLVRAMRTDGRAVLARLVAKRGPKAAASIEAKGRRVEVIRRVYGRSWWTWLTGDRRHGIGTHWTGGVRGLAAAAEFLLVDKSGTVATNAIVDYDGSAVILYPTIVDVEGGDPRLLYTGHGAHNPACFGLDFTGPGFLRPVGDGVRWETLESVPVPPELVSRCGVVHLDEDELRRWPKGPTSSVPWLLRTRPGSVVSISAFLAPTWAQIASYAALGRAHRILSGWTDADPVVVGHYQRADSRADPFHYPLAWLRAAILDESDLLAAGGWLARVNPAEVSDLLRQYRLEVRGSGW